MGPLSKFLEIHFVKKLVRFVGKKFHQNVGLFEKKICQKFYFVKKSLIQRKKVHHVHRGKKIKKKSSLEKLLMAHCSVLSND